MSHSVASHTTAVALAGFSVVKMARERATGRDYACKVMVLPPIGANARDHDSTRHAHTLAGCSFCSVAASNDKSCVQLFTCVLLGELNGVQMDPSSIAIT